MNASTPIVDTPRARASLQHALRSPAVALPTAVLALIVLAAALAPLVAPFDPNRSDLSLVLAPPDSTHLLGGDGAGRDVVSRLLWGAQTSLLAGAIATVTAILLGVPTGLIAGYRRGVVDDVSSWTADVLMAIPGIVALLVVVATFGTSMVPTMIALGVLTAPSFYRLTRSTVISVRAELYIDAARVSGLSAPRIVFRHILAVVATPVLIQAALTAGVAIIVQSGLAFLGLGDPLTPSWGAMVNDAYRNNVAAPLLTLWPGLAIGVTVAALALLGSGVADVLNRSSGSAGVLRAARAAARARKAARQSRVAHRGDATRADAVLRVSDLRVVYQLPDAGEREVVRGVSFYVNRGECLGIVGESGSGKSQTAFAVLGLLPREAQRHASELALSGENLLALNDKEFDRLRGTRISYVPQDPMSNLDPLFTVGAQMVEAIRAHKKVSRSSARAIAAELLMQVGIQDIERTLDAYPHNISGGMAQRVLIAIAVSSDPEVIIADEPTTALDVTVQAEVLELLRNLQRERNLALVLVTHNLGVVADSCDRVAVMRDGKIVESAAVHEIFAHPRHPYTKELLGSAVTGTQRRSRLRTPEMVSPIAEGLQ